MSVEQRADQELRDTLRQLMLEGRRELDKPRDVEDDFSPPAISVVLSILGVLALAAGVIGLIALTDKDSQQIGMALSGGLVTGPLLFGLVALINTLKRIELHLRRP